MNKKCHYIFKINLNGIYVLDPLEKQSRVRTYMIDSVKNIGNIRFHVSSEQQESLCQEIKYEVFFW